MAEKSFVEIQGTFLVKIHDNTLNGIIGENTFKHIDYFLEVVGLLKVKGLTQDRFRLSVFPISLAGSASEWFKKDCIGLVTTWEDLAEKFVQKFYQLSDDNEEMEADEDDDPDDIAEIFKIKGNLFDHETPLYNGVPYQMCDHICEPYRFKNGKTKWPTCSSDIDGFCNSGELPGIVRAEALMHKAKVEESWGDATPGVIKFCAWLKSSFENFLKPDHDVLVKLEECWWKVNAHEVAPFTRWENYGRGPNYGADNAGNTQENQEHKKEHHNPSPCRVRRFEMIKYSFDVDDEYVAIKEHESSDH
ncbi:hypothetical protein Tco_0277578 [Tanacetum coccineum]